MTQPWVLTPMQPDDLLSHRASWRQALALCRDGSMPSPGLEHEDPGWDDDRSYWQHELDVFDRVFDELEKRHGKRREAALQAHLDHQRYIGRQPSSCPSNIPFENWEMAQFVARSDTDEHSLIILQSIVTVDQVVYASVINGGWRIQFDLATGKSLPPLDSRQNARGYTIIYGGPFPDEMQRTARYGPDTMAMGAYALERAGLTR